VARPFQVVGNQVGNIGIVFDDENGRHTELLLSNEPIDGAVLIREAYSAAES
jgi:hypothetical protein